MDWNKYKKYGNWDCQDKISFWDVVNEFLDEDNDNVVADVTDSYKELSSERIKEQMDLMTMYNNNKAFKDYVDKYSVCNNKTVEESIKDNIVINYAMHIANPKEKEDWILGK